MSTDEPRSTLDRGVEARVAQVARSSYGKLVAILAADSGDIAGAEDALSDAIERALGTWVGSGIPANPSAWLLTVARNRIRDRFRSAAVRTSVCMDESVLQVPVAVTDPHALPDKQLELMLVCAHPAIDPAIRTPLMLQAILGVEAARIAEAYAVPASTMAQRLVRAKHKIRAAAIPFVIPDRDDLPGRLTAVLEAVYGAFAIDWRGIAGVTERDSLAGEALHLARTLTAVLPEDPEVLGLNALIALSAARSAARTDADATLVPVAEQDTRLWDAALIDEGETLLERAHAAGRPGRFQLEAAVQSVHCARRATGVTDWTALEVLYAGLLAISPTLGAAVSLAVVLAERHGPKAGLEYLDTLDQQRLARFQPAWATRADLLARHGDWAEAVTAYETALALTTDPPMRRFLIRRLAHAGVALR